MNMHIRGYKHTWFPQIIKYYGMVALVLHFHTAEAQVRKTTSLDDGWHFFQGDVAGASAPSFNDAGWQQVAVPHDWSITGAYNQANTTGRGGGYLPAGIGWYRKTFSLPAGDEKKQYWVEFDGVMANSEVWLNGVLLGKRPYGYISFRYDVTKHLAAKGKANVLVVKADNTVQPASRYYTGAGIYRHVRLVAVNKVHIAPWGVFVTTPVVTEKRAIITVNTAVENEDVQPGKYTLQTEITDNATKTVKTVESEQQIPAGGKAQITQNIEIANPQLWDVANPHLYKVVTRLLAGKTVIDDQATDIGLRNAKFEAATGFWLNGRNIKIKGVCLHHDGGAVGAAVPLSVWEDRFRLLKQVGVNAIRTSHNPVAPEFLDLCDRMGFLVMDETFDTWTKAKNNGENGYNLFFKEWWERDTRDMVLRDRNHPSIILYSIGNEIHDDLSYPEGYKVYKEQQDVVHQYDTTRPVTMALFRPANSKVYDNGFAEHMEVVGQNYREKELIAAHEAHPSWKVIGTENTHVLAQWLALRDKPYMAGQFLWTGFDYLGEADWPEITNNQGLFDRAGNWKQESLQRESWWSDKPVVHIVRKSDNAGAGTWVADWTPTDFDTYDNAKVAVYSNCDEVELFLNGNSLGIKPKPADDAPREWDVTFEKGTIKAVAKNKGKQVASEEFTSAGAPAKIIVSSAKSALANTWDDAAIVRAVIVDANGIPCPNAANQLSFKIAGSGVVDAVDNGDVLSHELYKGSVRNAFRGRAIAIVKATKDAGEITITVSADNLQAGTLTLSVKP